MTVKNLYGVEVGSYVQLWPNLCGTVTEISPENMHVMLRGETISKPFSYTEISHGIDYDG